MGGAALAYHDHVAHVVQLDAANFVNQKQHSLQFCYQRKVFMKNDANAPLSELPSDALDALIEIEKAGILSDENCSQYPHSFLLEIGLIERCWDNSFAHRVVRDITIPLNALQLTNAGRLQLAWHRARKSEKDTEEKRYRITTAIAVVALIISLLALAGQLGLLQLPQFGSTT